MNKIIVNAVFPHVIETPIYDINHDGLKESIQLLLFGYIPMIDNIDEYKKMIHKKMILSSVMPEHHKAILLMFATGAMVFESDYRIAAIHLSKFINELSNKNSLAYEIRSLGIIRDVFESMIDNTEAVPAIRLQHTIDIDYPFNVESDSPMWDEMFDVYSALLYLEDASKN